MHSTRRAIRPLIRHVGANRMITVGRTHRDGSGPPPFTSQPDSLMSYVMGKDDDDTDTEGQGIPSIEDQDSGPT